MCFTAQTARCCSANKGAARRITESRAACETYSRPDNLFFVAGDAFRAWFLPKEALEGEPDPLYGSDFNLVRRLEYVRVEEGRFDPSGTFLPSRPRNGDEVDFGVWADADAGVIRVTLR